LRKTSADDYDVAWGATVPDGVYFASDFVTSGAYGITLTATGITSLTLPTSGTLLSTASSAGSFPTLNQNTTGTAANVSGIVAIANGGTGAPSAASARTALGLVIGTDVLAPTGSAASLTNFPTLNQNTTGSAATLTTARAISISGDLTWSVSFNGSAAVSAQGTLATVNSNVGSFGSATQSVALTVNSKGLVEAASASTITPAVGSITGLGTGVSDALAIATNSTGGFPTINGTATLTNKTISGASNTITNVPISTGISGMGTGVATFLATPSSANLRSALTDETGTGAAVFATSPTLVTPILGTPTSGTLTSCTGLPISTGVSGLGTGVATFLATPTSANLRSALTDETGTGSAVFATSPTLVTPILGTPTSGTLTSCTGLPISTGVSGLGAGVATALAIAPNASGGFLTSSGFVSTAYKRSGTGQTLASATPTFLIFPTSVKTHASFDGTTFTAPSTGYARVSGLALLSGTISGGDPLACNFNLVVTDNGTAITPDLYGGYLMTNSVDLLSDTVSWCAIIPITSGHAYKLQATFDNGGDNATFGTAEVAWEVLP
jgi:hypothetical protein